MVSTLSDFIKGDLQHEMLLQKQNRALLINFATLATFFSAVTVTALQMSVGATGSALKDAVNFFFFASLFSSVTCAMHSFTLANLMIRADE